MKPQTEKEIKVDLGDDNANLIQEVVELCIKTGEKLCIANNTHRASSDVEFENGINASVTSYVDGVAGGDMKIRLAVEVDFKKEEASKG